MRSPIFLALTLAAIGCGAAPIAPPVGPKPASTPTSAPAQTGDAFAIEGPVRDEQAPLLKGPTLDPASASFADAPPGVAKEPAECAKYVADTDAAKGAACASREAALALVDKALEERDPLARDRALAAADGACASLPIGLVRAIRAEMAPPACAESLVAPLLKSPPKGMGGPEYNVLGGLALAGRLARVGVAPPKLDPPYDVKRVKEFTQGTLSPWFVAQAAAVQQIAEQGVKLQGYAKGSAAIAAGIADLRLVDIVRSAPLPDPIAKDPELASQYYGSLDQALDPRKDRGRDAVLVGLREMALTGVLSDARVTEARALLARLYGGRRIDALDQLALPGMPAFTPASLEERLAARLPTYYAGVMLDEAAGTRAKTLRALLERGLPLPQRNALRSATLPSDVAELYARARFELGRLYWRAVDFDQAASVEASAREKTPDGKLVGAVAIALRFGPEDAIEMMRKAPVAAAAPGKTVALEALVAEKGTNAPMAAYDAALVKLLVAPPDAPATYFENIAQRFREAAALQTDPKLRALATDHASSADAVAKAIASGGTAPKPR